MTDGEAIRPGARTALVVLTLINLLNYLDRFIVPAVGESLIHSELHLSDRQFGYLASVFLIVYMMVAPVFGTLGDRRPRPRLIASGIALWSLATAAAGLARGFPSLLLARSLVGVGEASYSTIAPAMLADYFPERLRGRVLAVFFAATPVGSALGYVVGGLLNQHVGWRGAFFVAGVPGLLLALAALRLNEPPRSERQSESHAATSDAPGNWLSGVGAVYIALFRNRLFLLAVLGYAAYTFALGGMAVWMPAFLERVRHLPAEVATVRLGIALIATGFIGTFAGGWLADRLQAVTRNANLAVCAVSSLAAVPAGYLALASPDPRVYWPALIIAEILLFCSTSPVNAAVLNAVPASTRAAAMATCIFLIHVLGDVPSPTIIGAISTARDLPTAVNIIPVAILLSGLIWSYAALHRGRPATA